MSANRRQAGIRSVERLRIESSKKRAVILIVEDDALIRMEASFIISDDEFDVIEAASADEAIEILEARRDVTVLFTDIQMPGSMDGLKLAAAVRDRWPPILIVATSGHVSVSEDDLPDGARFLPKPYSPTEILTTLRELTAA